MVTEKKLSETSATAGSIILRCNIIRRKIWVCFLNSFWSACFSLLVTWRCDFVCVCVCVYRSTWWTVAQTACWIVARISYLGIYCPAEFCTAYHSYRRFGMSSYGPNKDSDNWQNKVLAFWTLASLSII